MVYDIYLLKADADAGTDVRIARAREVARDSDAPRRALAATGDVAESPDWRAGSMFDPYRNSPGPSLDYDWDQLFCVANPDAPEGASVSDLSPVQRQAGYDSLDVDLRAVWDRDWHAAAQEWVAALEAWGPPTSSHRRWERHVEVCATADGGHLLVCATHEDEQDGVPSWFEAVRFSLVEIAYTAGFREPTRYDVD